MTHRCFDAAWPPAGAPVGCDAALIYAGGDTPNPIADPSTVEAYKEVRYWVPAYVRSNPVTAHALNDANEMIGWLLDHHVPSGTATMLDFETAVLATYVNEYWGALKAAGYKVLVYGSLGKPGETSVFQNPACDGYWPADPTGVAHLIDRAGTVATQYAFVGTYDLSLIADSVPLWDTQPSPVAPIDPPVAGPPGSTPLTPEEEKTMIALNLPDGKVAVYAIGGGDRAGQLLEFVRTPGQQTAEGMTVLDVTDQLGGPDPYTVSG